MDGAFRVRGTAGCGINLIGRKFKLERDKRREAFLEERREGYRDKGFSLLAEPTFCVMCSSLYLCRYYRQQEEKNTIKHAI